MSWNCGIRENHEINYTLKFSTLTVYHWHTRNQIQPAAQLQVSGAVYVTPFSQALVQIAVHHKSYGSINYYLTYTYVVHLHLPLLHREPVQPAAQVQVSGAEHVPPFSQTLVQIAVHYKSHRCINT